jgi:hypothetical protein
MSKLAEEIVNSTTGTITDLLRIAEVLAAHGITDDLVEQHRKANEWLRDEEKQMKMDGLPVHPDSDFGKYIVAERAAGRWIND